MKQRLLYLIFSLVPLATIAQQDTLNFGLVWRPILPTTFLPVDGFSQIDGDNDYLFEQKFGYGLGMCVRKNFSNRFAFQSGLEMVQRNYAMTIHSENIKVADKAALRVVGYEIPLMGLIYVPFSDELFMNAAFGAILDFKPSDVQIEDANFFVTGARYRNTWMNIGLHANTGFEYRTKKEGSFYVGASFHRPFGFNYTVLSNGKLDPRGSYNTSNELTVDLRGAYFSLDLRYFFSNEND